MAQALVTPKDLRDFANILQQNIEDFTQVENSMNQKLYGYDWRDEVAEKFKADFEATKEPLNKLRQQMEEFIPHLEEKANTLDSEYLATGSGPSIDALKATAAAFAGIGAGAATMGMGGSPSLSALKTGAGDDGIVGKADKTDGIAVGAAMDGDAKDDKDDLKKPNFETKLNEEPDFLKGKQKTTFDANSEKTLSDVKTGDKDEYSSKLNTRVHAEKNNDKDSAEVEVTYSQNQKTGGDVDSTNIGVKAKIDNDGNVVWNTTGEHKTPNSQLKTDIKGQNEFVESGTMSGQYQSGDTTIGGSYTANQNKDNAWSMNAQQKLNNNLSAGVNIGGTDQGMDKHTESLEYNNNGLKAKGSHTTDSNKGNSWEASVKKDGKPLSYEATAKGTDSGLEKVSSKIQYKKDDKMVEVGAAADSKSQEANVRAQKTWKKDGYTTTAEMTAKVKTEQGKGTSEEVTFKIEHGTEDLKGYAQATANNRGETSFGVGVRGAFGKKPPKPIKSNKLTDHDLQRLSLQGIYPSFMEIHEKNSRDKYKDILDIL
ncbi:MAG: hypothetical protein FWG84_01485 [Bacteroidales bacterium]|nr:hypothetical protein [Bacteroidales bacterium]